MNLQTFSKDKRLHLILVGLMAVVAYLNVLPNQFVIDDHVFIEEWETIRSVNIPAFFGGANPEVHEGVYRPVRSLLYSIYYQLWGTWAPGYHLHSISVHTAASLMVYLVIGQLASWKSFWKGVKDKSAYQPRLIAFMAALLFALHPIHTEAITYIAASMEMIGTVFFLVAWYFYLRFRKTTRRLKRTNYLNNELMVSLLFCVLAFFTYEMTLTLPLVIMMSDYIFGRFKLPSWRELLIEKGSRKGQINWSSIWPVLKTWLFHYGGFWLIAFVYAFVRVVLLKVTSRGDYLGYSFFHTQLAMLKVHVKYIWLLVNPLQISYLHMIEEGFESFSTVYSNIYSIRTQSIFDWDIMAALAFLLSLVFIVWKMRTKRPVISFSILLHFFTLIPVFYLIPQGIALAEKYLYLASIGFVLLIAYGVMNLSKYRRELGFAAVILLSIFYLGVTVRRNTHWLDEVTFWQNTVKQHPQSAFARYSYGVQLNEKGLTDEAFKQFSEAIEYEPRMVQAYYNQARILAGQGLIDQAIRLYNKVLEIDPSFSPALEQIEKLSAEAE